MKDLIVFYGATWCGDCMRSKAFLESHEIPFSFINIDENEEAANRVVELNNGSRSIPTIVFPDGEVLVEPTNEALATKLGIQE